MANPDVFNSLAPSQQDALTGAAAATLDNVLRITADSDAEAVAKLCAAGVTFDVATDAQLAELEAAVRPVIDKLRADPAKAAQLDRDRGAQGRGGRAAEHADLHHARRAPRPRTPSAFPNGTYTRTGTVGDIRRSGAEQRLKDIGFDFTGEPDSAGVTANVGVRRRPGHQGCRGHRHR